jgi:hypothetical protein
MSIKDGGSAFPVPGDYSKHGMTLRDYFAAAALQGCVAKYGGADYSTLAIYAYGFADAMLAKREAK